MISKTPYPYSFANNTGTAAKLKLFGIESPMHAVSLNKPDLPRETVLISRSNNVIHYRIQYSAYDYALVDVFAINNGLHQHGKTYISGSSPDMDSHQKFMETILTLHPVVMQLFSS